MRFGELLAYYLKSPLGIGSLAGSAGLALLGMALGLPFLPSAAGALALALLTGVVSLAGGAGARAIAEAKGVERARDVRRRVSEAEEIKSRLAGLRISDAEVSAALGAVVLAAGEYLESCKTRESYDPEANFALESALEIVGLHLSESNETSVERRFSLPDENPFEDPKGRVVAGLKEKASTLRRARLGLEGGLGAGERMAIEEELR